MKTVLPVPDCNIHYVLSAVMFMKTKIGGNKPRITCMHQREANDVEKIMMY